jgi:ribosomal protein S27AE
MRRLPRNLHLPKNVYVVHGGFQVKAQRRGISRCSPTMLTVAESVAWRDQFVEKPQIGLFCPACGHTQVRRRSRVEATSP